jgi:hypothetical protein
MITTYCYDKNGSIYQRINPDGTCEPYSWERGPNSSAGYLFEQYSGLTEEEKAAFRKLLGFQTNSE